MNRFQNTCRAEGNLEIGETGETEREQIKGDFQISSLDKSRWRSHLEIQCTWGGGD